MRNSFLAQYHFASDKFSDRWCKEVANYICYQGGCINLLYDKKVKEIEDYSTGKIDMRPFINNFKRYKRLVATKAGDAVNLTNNDILDIAFQPLPLLVSKLNSAESLVTKRELDITVKAMDSLAEEKIKKDIDFLKNSEKIRAIKQELADELGQGDIEPEFTKNSSMSFSKVPLNLDLNDPAELNIFKNIVYKFLPEASFENILDIITKLKKVEEVERLLTSDQLKYGVSVVRTFEGEITGISEVQRVHPSYVFTPRSEYNDFRDIPYLYAQHNPTVNEFFNEFGSEIKDANKLHEIINGEGGYCECNNIYSIPRENWNTSTVCLYEVQVKVIDGVAYVENKNGNKQPLGKFENFKDKVKDVKGCFGQNTYTFFWLPKTNYFFGKKKLGFAHRKFGLEAFCEFSYAIYRSQKKGAVEQCIGENKKAIVASIKLNHEVLKALANGKYIDLKYFRNAATALADEGKTISESVKELIDMALEENIVLGDTEGFDAQSEGNFMPVRDIAGGLTSTIGSYITIIRECQANISKYTGITDELVGFNNNPNLLNRAREILADQANNSIDYLYQARLYQLRVIYNIISWNVKEAIRADKAGKKTIERLIGMDRTNAIKDISSIKEHTFFLDINLGRTPEQIQAYQFSLMQMEQKGLLSRPERMIVENVSNPKEAFMLLSILEDKAIRKADAQRQEAFQQQQALVQQRNEGLIAQEQKKIEGKLQEIYTTADANSKLMMLGNQLGAGVEQIKAYQQRMLQSDRLLANRNKQERQIQADQQEILEEKISPLV